MASRPSRNPFKVVRSHLSSGEQKAETSKELDAAGASASNNGFLSPPAASRREGHSSSRPRSPADDEPPSDQRSEASSAASDNEVPNYEPDVGEAGSSFWEQAYQKLVTDPETKPWMEDYTRILAESKKEADIEGKKADGDAATENSENDDCEEPPPTNLGRESEMTDLVSKKLKKMQEKEWVVKWKGREVFRVRKAVTATVKIVQKFSGLAAGAAGLDPLHAGLAWAGVSCVLPLLINDTTERTKAVEGVSSTAQVTERYVWIERDYRKGLFGSHTDFETTAITLCSEILKFYAKAAIYFARNSWKKWLRNTCKIDDWTSALDAITKADEACRTFSAIITSSKLLEGREEIGKLLADHEKDEIHKMVAWVSDTKVGLQHNQVRAKLGGKYAGSGQWLLDLQDFVAWKDSPHGHFWLRGAVGTGKSSLVSIVVELLKGKTDSFAYFYCTNVLSAQERQKQRPKTTVLRALAAQLVLSPDKTTIAEEVKIEYDKSVSLELAGTELGYEASLKLLSRLIASRDSTTIVIDALDECPEYVELLGGLEALAEQNGNLKIFVSSQLIVQVDTYLKLRTITIDSAQNTKDIESFVKGETEKFRVLRKGVLTERLSLNILETLPKKAEGMFKWVELSLNFLLDPSDEEDEKAIQKNLDIIKKKPNQGVLRQMVEAYEKLYRKHLPTNITKQETAKLKAEKILAWVFAAVRPLHVREILCLDDEGYVKKLGNKKTSDQTIMKVCRSFLFISEEGHVEMSHSSVSDYLALKLSGKVDELLQDAEGKVNSDKLLEDAHNLSKVSANTRVAKESISYLISTKNLKLGQNHTIDAESLLPYAAEFWDQHAKAAIRTANKALNEDQQNTLNIIPNTLNAKIRELMDSQNQQAFDNWLTIHDPDKVNRIKNKDHTSGDQHGQQLYYAMFLGFWVVARDMIDEGGWDVNIVGGYFGTCLQLASCQGNEQTVSKLLEKHASTNKEAGVFGTALQAAAAGGHQAICSLLLKNGADANIQGGLLCNALQAALARGSIGTIDILRGSVSSQVDTPHRKRWKEAFIKLPERRRQSFAGELARHVATDLPQGLTFEQKLLALVVAISRDIRRRKVQIISLQSLEGQEHIMMPFWAQHSPHDNGIHNTIFTKILESDKYDELYLYNQLPWVMFYLIIQSTANQRKLDKSDYQAINLVAQITLEHEYYLEHMMPRENYLVADLLVNTLTLMYMEIFQLQLSTLIWLHQSSFRRFYQVFKREKQRNSVDAIISSHERTKIIEQALGIRAFPQRISIRPESTAILQENNDPIVAVQTQATVRDSQDIPARILQTTVEALKDSREVSQKFSDRLLVVPGIVGGSDPGEQLQIPIQAISEACQNYPKTQIINGDNTSERKQGQLCEKDETTVEDCTLKEAEFQATKPMAREEELSAELTGVRKEMSQLKEEVKELCDQVKKLSRLLKRKDLLRSSSNNNSSEDSESESDD